MNLTQVPVFDATALASLRELEGEDEPNLVASLVKDFTGNSHELLGGIQKFFRIADLRNLEIASHSLKSSARLLGCFRLEKACSQIEECSRDGDLQFCAEVIASLPELVSITLLELNANWDK